MPTEYPNVLLRIGASAGGQSPPLEIIDHLSSGYPRSSSPYTARPTHRRINVRLDASRIDPPLLAKG